MHYTRLIQVCLTPLVEVIPDTLLFTIIGLIIAFLVFQILGTILLFITINKLTKNGTLNTKKQNNKSNKSSVSSYTDAITNSYTDVSNKDEIVAVITAAVAAYIGSENNINKSMPRFRVVSFRKISK